MEEKCKTGFFFIIIQNKNDFGFFPFKEPVPERLFIGYNLV